MATRIRTLDFLPEIFKTTTNSQFLAATLDQLVAQPNTKQIQGYVGSRFGYGVNANDYYVTEPNKTRKDYQLDPGVVFLKQNETTANDFISYPGIVDGLNLEGGITENNSRLFTSQFYSWDSFTDLDKIINFNQYYWLPTGPERVIVSSSIVYNTANYIVQSNPNYYLISSETQPVPSANPTLTLLRGGTYTFAVNQNSQFWIQGAPGVTGLSPTQPNVQTRDVYGVSNNGAEQGVVTFTVPKKNALDEYNFPGNNPVGVVSTLPFSEVNGALVNSIGGIDGVTALDGLTVMFYNTGVENESGYVQKFYDQTLYDQDGGVAYNEATDYPGSSANYNNYEGGFYSEVNANFYTITLIGEIDNPIIQLTPAGVIPTNQNIIPSFGTEWINRRFYRNTAGFISLVPYNSAILDTLYYQDGTSPNKVGIINLIQNNKTNQINVITDILGKTNYTASNGVVFTNGLKVLFQGDIFPASFNNVEYYVEGVGTAIELIPVATLVSPGQFSESAYIPYDTTAYDVGNYDSNLYIPITPEYITIARNAINRNAWSRSNRWFHIDVINASAAYNNNPLLVSTYTVDANKAKRPIIEFYPNLRMFDAGALGKNPIDFIDTRTTDAFSLVAGQANYYPDTAGYTAYNAVIAPVTGAVTTVTATNTYSLVNQVALSSVNGLFVNDTITFGGSVFGNIVSGTKYYITGISGNTVTISTTKQGSAFVLVNGSGTMSTSIYPYSTTITIPSTDVFGLFEAGQYITDSTEVLPRVTYITNVTTVGYNTVITVSWDNQSIIAATSVASVVSADTTLDNYSLFDGSRVVFAADTNIEVRNKIYVSRFSTISTSSIPVITLTEAEDGAVLPDEQTAIYRGYYNRGKDFYFNGVNWYAGQQKTQINQAPRFDIFDHNGISFGDKLVYVGTSFIGSTLFSYGLGIGANDSVLGFPIRYSAVANVGDISFDVTLNSQTFNYVTGTTPITQKVNTGYVYNYQSRVDFVRELGWQTAVSPSVQYQIFDFDWTIVSPVNEFTCDVAPVSSSSTNWPTVQVYVNNTYLDSTLYTVTVTENSTKVLIPTIDAVSTVIQILVLSDQVSATGYYQVPTNLSNNPLNEDITTASVGDIRGQYQSIFFNNPNTTGIVFGSNNYRDLGNLVPWGTRIIQNSASLVLPGTFLRKQNHNLFNSLLYNSRQYVNFKNLLIDTVNKTPYATAVTPAQIFDGAMDKIAASKSDSQSFFWSDMVPSKAPFISNTYSFANTLDTSIYPLSRIYNFTTSNYYGVLVYLTRTTDGVTSVTQLTTGIDYTVSTNSPSLTVTLDLLANDIITINEYNQTYGSYVPNTPTKLGLFPATIPSITLDTAYTPETYFIVGHDGSYNKLYGTYNTTTGQLNDYRDQVLLEYETRVYNNLKLSNVIPVQLYEVLPGFFRDTGYSYDEFLQIYSESFLNWVGENRIDYKRQVYNRNNQYTFNYRDSGNKINQQPIEQGYFRGLYLYYYDTSTPNVTPWEMLGFTKQPSWWTARYGAAPYTSENLVLWGDLAAGIDWNNGNPIVLPRFVRPQLLKVLPVDSAGNLVSPFVSILGNYNQNTFNRDWKVGDVGPAEFSYRRSSTWPFDLMRILALTKPAEFFNLGVDVDNYKYNVEFNQYLVNDRSHLVVADVAIYGNGTPATSYINWIVDFEKQVGIDATANITTLLDNLDVRLVYRLAGFSDKNLLKFYVEKSSANSNNSSLLIPDESYGVLLYENQPFDRIVYSSVAIQITENGFKVYGNSQTNAYFTTLVPKINNNTDKVSIENLSAVLARDFYDKVALIPYGTEFYNVQQVATFLNSYGKYLESQGVKFEEIENGIPINWPQMVAEFLYWAQIGWEVGSIATINPAANTLSIDKDSHIVQPLTLRETNFVLNQNLYPIQSRDLLILRQNTAFAATPLNVGDSISYGQFNISNIEHGIVFNNVTLFNDIIYNLVTGLRQYRVYLRGAKSADWNGTVDAAGFILNQDNITEWVKEIKYTKGAIVRYKNRYWAALSIIQAQEVFNEREWKETPYAEIQKGLLPNSSTRSYESTLYYDTDKANLENDADLLSFSLIGYRPRDYMALADLTDITQVNVYKNMIKEKGTLNAASAFKGANLPQGGINYDIYENWAIKSGEFGGVLNNNFIEFRLSQPDLTGNPSIVGLTAGVYNEGVQQEVPLYSVFNYGRPINTVDILPTISNTQLSSLYPTAGYVNYNDVKMASYFYSGLATARNSSGTVIPISQFYVRDYVWLANYLADWQVYTPASLGSIVNAQNNLNGTVTITFGQAHTLKTYQIFAIANFNASINNYYIVAGVVDPFRVIINLSLDPNTINITGLGIGFRMQSQRVATAPEIINLPLLDNEFNKLKVWVDTNNDGSWAVYRKTLNYQYDKEILRNNSQTFGSAVAYTSKMGYLIGDSAAGEVYRYTYDNITDSYRVVQTIAHGVSFGSYISYADDLFVISEPTITPNVYVYQLITNTLVDTVSLLQTIVAPNTIGNWGSSTSMSGDKKWLYISDIESNRVYVYRQSTITKLYELVNILTVAGLVSGDNFGYSLVTDYYGDTVVVGAPDQNYDTTIENYGYTYIFARTSQNFEAQTSSQAYTPLTFQLAFTPSTLSTTANSISSNAITLGSVSGLTDGATGTPIVFTGTPYGGVAANIVYYVKLISGSTITLSLTRDGDTLTLTNSTGTMTATGQISPLYLTVNGTLLEDNMYAVVGSILNVYSGLTPTLNAGDIINVGSSEFTLAQTLTNEETPRIGVQFGTSVDTNTFANEILVGAPFELSEQNYEGAVHRYTNGGEKYGIIIGTANCNITTPRTILLNGFQVTLPIGDATTAANAINLSSIINVYAAATNGKLIITLVDIALGVAGSKLSLTILDSDTLGEMGVVLYKQTQKINSPHLQGRTQFGTVVKFGTSGSIVVSAPVGTRYAATTFDFTDDEIDNDTVFDNNATQWTDTFTNAGAVYMFDYLSAYNENLDNPGKFVYAQSTNAKDLDYGSQPYYGSALDFNENRVVVGATNFSPTTNANDTNGQVVTYISASNNPDWTVYRSSSAIVDINGIANIQLFSATTNNTLENLDYIDPLQGKLLGAVAENIDVVSNVDPAGYNNSGNTQSGLVWVADKVGQLWFNTANSRFINYHQNDIVYNSKYWGRVFPGSTVTVYSWIASNVPPAQYQGPGTPYNIDNYVIESIINAEGTLTPVYYFWARNTNIIFERLGKTLADSTLEGYIANPQASGISYFTPLLPSVFGLYNCFDFINATDTVLHIGYATGTNDDVAHNQYSLIRANYADDFLDGLPGSAAGYQNHAAVGITSPIGLYNRMLDSMCGVDNSGAVVPDPFLPKLVQSGVLARPRQSFFYNRFGALKNYLQYANAILSQFPIIEIRNPQFLYSSGEFYDTAAYWSLINWWAPGYSNNTKSAIQVAIYADLSTLNVASGTIVTVATNGNGNSETYRYDGAGVWTRIGLENGTIEFSSYLWDYSSARLGFGDNFFDTTPYDEFPSVETRYIVRALNEEIYTGELLIFRNKSLILLFDYIQSETVENQNYLPWLNKTSFLDVSHTIRELRPIEVFQSDNQDFLSGYLNEVKPYHVVIKDFLFKYTGINVYEGDITDFDLPAKYNSSIDQFVSPQLVYANPSGVDQYLYTDPIWQDVSYSQWFNNYGLSIIGQNGYQISVLTSYLSLNSSSCFVDNVSGFPVVGTILIGTEEIGYNSRNLATNELTGLSRGVNGTTVSVHIPGEYIFIDLPAVLVLNSGRAYAEPPRVTAYIDLNTYPIPRVVAQLEPIMSLGAVIGVNVIDPGEGYAVLPQIIIDPSLVVSVNSTQVSIVSNTIQLISPLLQTGDLIVYTAAADSTKISGLIDGQKYYVNLLEVTPYPIIALYSSYLDALNDQNRIVLVNAGSGTQNFSIGAVASCITSSVPTRENIIALRFDRTSYTSQVIPWEAAGFYGAFYAGSFNNSSKVSSSAITLESTQPPISSILASADGAAFEILDVANQQTLTWSSRTRNTIQTYGSASLYPNTIRINPTVGGADVNDNIGSTIGFYVGMPVKFEGAAVGNLINYTTYYVKSLVKLPNPTTSVLEDTGFTISSTVDVDGNPGATFTLSTATVPVAGLTMFVGQLTNQAVLTVNYDAIRNATATTATTNNVTVLLTATGLAGTTGFYVGLPIYFTGNVFGDVVANEKYYVTTVIDAQTFTMSTVSDPTVLTCTATSSSNNSVTCSSTLGLTVNEPIIFTGNTIGNIVAGTTYYIRELFSGNTTFSVATAVNGSAVILTTDTGSFTVTSQINAVPLSTGTGSMTLNVAVPISPGQVTGQEFTLYETSSQYTGVSGTVSNLTTREISATLSTVNRVCLLSNTGGITNIYTGMRFKVASNIGGLLAATPYYTITDSGITSITVTSTTGTNYLVCADTNVLYEGMPIIFSGTSLGQVALNVIYYVKQLVSATDFTISEVPGGTDYTTNTDSGTMYGSGEPYIEVADTLTNATGAVVFTQVTVTAPIFDVSYILGGYRTIIQLAGEGYAVDNTITILGTSIGGTTTSNDLLLTVLTIDSIGGVTSAIASGTPAGTVTNYYLKVISENQMAVYSNSILTAPVTGQNFPYVGTTSTTATIATAANNRFTVTSSTSFNLNDLVVFTGNVFGGVTLGQTYYVLSKPTTTTVTISETLGGTVFDITTNASGSMTMAKSGDYALLPEPFFFSSSIVKYNKQVYQCIISNNDNEFILGKWELLDSGNRRLNALDRIIGYYQPTVNMPGVDLTQLVDGITYPNSNYLGNAFAPADEFILDTILIDQPFAVTGVDLKTIVWNGITYLAGSDTATYSAISASVDTNNWTITKLTNQSIGITDILFAGSQYVLTSTNSATPLLVSDNGFVWITNGAFTPYDSTPYDITNFDLSSLIVPSSFLNSAAYHNGVYVAVGSNIISSIDLYSWTERYQFTSSALTNQLNSVAYVSTTGFTGFVAVGAGQYLDNGIAVDVGIIFTSTDGYTWNQVTFTATNYGFNSIAANSENIVIVGNNGVVFTSTNAVTWFAQSSGGIDDLNNIIWDNDNSLFVVVGKNGTIKTAPINGITWTSQTSGVTQDLTSVVWNNDLAQYVTVGYNNTILISSDAITWTASAVFETAPSAYNIQGDAFLSGYGPEEMVPGVVSDTIMMTVATRPGTNWDETIYQHVGYNVVSKEIAPTSGSQTDYSFAHIVTTPAQLSVFVIDYTTGVSTTIYENIDYAIDWINKLVILNTPLVFVSQGVSNILRIDVYEVGNGDQLVKANTETDPVRLNLITGFQEIYVNANYSADIYNGSGLIRPTTEPIEILATATDGISNAITCTSVIDFVLNSPITFSGAVFGNIVEDQIYYVKSISGISNKITVSLYYNSTTGTAGETFELTTAVGSMTAIIQVGTGVVWTPPAVYDNGTQLVLGTLASVFKTKAITNTITTNSTGSFIPNTTIVFSDTIFGGVIVPHQIYYIKTIYDNNEFTISETVGGSELVLTNATGGATLITNDFAIGIADNGITAALIFANNFNVTEHYISYSLFGQTYPIQYGYTIPQVQIFAGNGSSSLFYLDNYVGDTNTTSAIVEINGIRQTASAYTISAVTNTILFNSPPALDSSIAVTSYNLTERQYFNTQYGVTGSTGSTVTTITVSNTVHSVASFDENSPNTYTFDEDSPEIVLFDQELNYLTLGSGTTASLLLNYPIIFNSPTLGGLIAGVTYYVTEILSSTDFTVSTQLGGLPTVVTTDTGTMTGVVNGVTVANIVYINNSITPPAATVNVNSTDASDYISCDSTTSLVVDQNIIFKAPIFAAGSFGVGKIYQITTLIGTTQLQWNTTAGTVGVVYAVGDIFTAATTGSGTGQALLANVGGIDTTGQVYFIKDILNLTDFTIADEFGTLINLTNSSDNIQGYMGGSPAIRVTTGINNNLTENALVRIDGTLGSIQLNNNTYYAKIISSTVFDLYSEPYNPALNAINYPVIFASNYISGGYVWKDGIFTIDSDFEQVNVDRLWVTINGYRVPSSSLKLNANNNLSILSTIVTGDSIIITSMMPTATPNEEVYLLNVSTTNRAAVYRANVQTRTWLTRSLSYTDQTIYLNDISRITDTVVQNVITPSIIDGKYNIGLSSNKNVICHLTVYNNTTATEVNSNNYKIIIVDTAPILQISAQVTTGDDLTITSVEGRLLYINGEQIGFGECNLALNTVTKLIRGTNGTGEQNYIPLYTEVFGLIPNNRMSDVLYQSTWNPIPGIYNPVEGDPLQIAYTQGAIFLRTDIS